VRAAPPIGRGLAFAASLLFLAVAACAPTVSEAPPAPQPAPPPPVAEAPPPEPAASARGPSGPLALPAGRVPIGLLLPLSGQHAALGGAMRDAAEMALFDTGRDSLVLLPRDTGGTPEGAAAAAESAIAEGARLLLGPIFSTEVAAAGGVARGHRVPLLGFTNDAEAAGDGTWVLGFRPGPQIDRLVTFASEKGSARFAVLAPTTAYGQLAAAEAERVIAARGGTMVGVEVYGEGNEDAQAAAQRLARAPADAVLIADAAQRALLLAPIYAYYEQSSSKAKMLGTSLWEDQPALSREPALYGGWFAAPTPEARAAFVARYRAMYGAAPPRIATLAYDAVALAASTAGAGEGELVDRLTQPSGFSGLDGLFRLLPNGLTDRQFAVLEVRRGRPPSVASPAPESFQYLTQ